MRRKFIIDKYFATSCFIQYGNFYPVSESRTAFYKDDIDIFNKCPVTNLVVSNIVLNILNTTIIAHCHIVQRNMAQTGVFLNSTRQSKFRPELSQFHFARKAGVVYILGREPFGYKNFFPIICQTRLAFQLKHFVLSQFPVNISHILSVTNYSSSS